MDNKGKPMRGVIVYDFEIDGNLMQAAAFNSELETFSKQFEQFLKDNNPKLAGKVNFSQTMAAVPMAERRGPTGDLDDIVFRGSRGKNEAIGRAKLPVGADGDEKRHLVAMRERLRRDKMPTPLIQQELDREWMGIKSGSIPVKQFRKYIKKDDPNAPKPLLINADKAAEDVKTFQRLLTTRGINFETGSIKVPREMIARHNNLKINWSKYFEIFRAMKAANKHPDLIQSKIERDMEEAIQQQSSSTSH